jgi:hypothetical protein
MEFTTSPANDVPPGSAFDAWRVRVLERAEFDRLGIGEQLEYFAAFALLAPTTHNTVPQRMRIDRDQRSIEFALDRRAILPQSDANGRQATISLGAAIANTVLAAEAYGLAAAMVAHPDVEPLIRPADVDDVPIVSVATVSFDALASPVRDLSWVSAMVRRKMVRAEFDERVKLDPSVASELASITQSVHAGLALHLISDAPTLLALGKFQELADSTVINRTAFARELAEWLVDNDSDQPLGMRGREFGLSDDAARRFRHGLAGIGPLLPDETAAFAKAGNIGMRSSSAVAVVAAARDDVEHRLAAGQAFEAMALRLTLAGFNVAMHAGITEVEAPNLALRGRLRTFSRPLVVFRVGKPLNIADSERPHSSRPRLADVLRESGT